MVNVHSEFADSGLVDGFLDSYFGCDLDDLVFAEQDLVNHSKAHDEISLSIQGNNDFESIFNGLKFSSFSPLTNQKFN